MTNTTEGLVCPKCQASMRQYERSGVIIDQCVECRGIFLDRGELERLIEAEDVHYQGAAQPAGPAPGYGPPPDGRQGGFLGQMLGGGRHGGYRRGHH